MLKTLGLIAVIGAGAAVVANATGAVGTVKGWYHDATGTWTEDACRASPEPCLKDREASLVRAGTAIDGAAEALGRQVERLAVIVKEREGIVGQNEIILTQGRTQVQQAATDPAKPISFAGRTYPNRDALVTQLDLLFRERQSLDSVLAQARSQQAMVAKRLDDLLISRGEIHSALALIPAQIELVRANGLLADVSSAVTTIDTTLTATEHKIGDLPALLGTTEELMRSSAQASAPPAGAPSAAFKEFLDSGKL